MATINLVTKFTLAIIAGGKSSRMGTNKAFEEVGGIPIIKRIIQRTADAGQDETILITNTPDDYAHLKLPMFADVVPDSGSLGGIYTALYHSKTPYTLVVACDMPFVDADFMRFMFKYAIGNDVVVPRKDDYPQGLHALYHQNCLEPIRKKLDAKRLKVIGFYDDVRVHYMPVTGDPLALMNVNTPEELAKAREIAED